MKRFKRNGEYRWHHKRTGLPVTVKATSRFKTRDEGWYVHILVPGEGHSGWNVPADALEEEEEA